MRKAKLTIAALFLLLILSQSVKAAPVFVSFLPMVKTSPVYVMDCMDSAGRFVECGN